MELQEYWLVIRSKICHRCMDGDIHGNCHLGYGQVCAIKSFLPKIVMVIENEPEQELEEYVNRLRLNVCNICEHQAANGFCQDRTNLECALDRYYPLVISAIETVKQQKEAA